METTMSQLDEDLNTRSSFSAARGVGHRFSVAFATLAVIAGIWLDYSSPLYALVMESNTIGRPFTIALAVMSCIAVLDAFVNDVLDSRYNLKQVAKGRLYFYMLQAAMHLAIFSTGLGRGAWSWSLLVFLSLAFSCGWIAVLDTYHRYIEPRTRPGQL